MKSHEKRALHVLFSLHEHNSRTDQYRLFLLQREPRFATEQSVKHQACQPLLTTLNEWQQKVVSTDHLPELICPYGQQVLQAQKPQTPATDS